MQVVLISGATGCGKTTQVTNSLPCLLYGTSNMACRNCVSEVAFLAFYCCHSEHDMQSCFLWVCSAISLLDVQVPFGFNGRMAIFFLNVTSMFDCIIQL